MTLPPSSVPIPSSAADPVSPAVPASLRSHAQLVQAYAEQGSVLGIFGPRVVDYQRSRPGYPEALYVALEAAGALCAHHAVADIGAGTGLFTLGLVGRARQIHAIEPSETMRAALVALLGSAVQARAGCAEATGLADDSVDLVTAAQCFHWFEPGRTRQELARILRPGGVVALAYNDRMLDAPVHRALDEIFLQFGGAQRSALLEHETRGAMPAFLGADYQLWSGEMVQWLDREGLIALVFSRSYMPERSTPAGRQAMLAVEALFERLCADDQGAARIALPYVSSVYWAQWP